MSADDPDAGLVARIGRGDEVATRMFVGAKLPRILALARRMLGDAAEAEDVAQETFLRAWKQAARWQPGAARFDTWLHTVTLNLCRDRLRRRQETVMPELPEVVDPQPPADAMVDEAAQAGAVQRAIDALPERQREALLLVHYQDLTNIAAADAMEISVEALESLLSRGRRSLRATFAARDTRDD
ncbi:RNA polymerase sigma factor [Sphingomonas sp. CGMCC 1.13654]|uniref:RNA polymerase sigma factor n=1 Tax=Sphingomonas chungangi TaxID=2683589 RepID=A0A838LBA0_9SPHN|nr:RNA polymerase sigma factor [Sphingomonas chungangi]MBA2936521.1 RNA polymerase sigma factor [Sphingomonas chungangi]MVW55906.1 RNA polymerase sigma factor [Sphingomonas chungangi]